MPIITEQELRQAASKRLNLNESIHAEIRKAFSDSPRGKEVTVFLSHSHKDQEQVKQLVVFLRKLGIRIYVDWMDDDMPQTTSGITASKIKEKIKDNKKFILLATNNAINSKWCNWELGLGDAAKYIKHISLFPVANNNRRWEGNEYLQIYPRIEKETGSIGYRTYEQWYVIYPNNNKTELETWLRS